jgi:radical SAM superfamily enzyme YgiQ (UPF0313 family)
MKLSISFADLAHSGHQSVMIPYGAAIVAAFAIKKFGEKIECDIFKKPFEYAKYLEERSPQIACFSNYIWNLNLSLEFSKRIKAKNPETIIIFGGPNYPHSEVDQIAFLRRNSCIDFYIYWDGEKSFAKLLDELIKHKLDKIKIKQSNLKLPSCHYISDGEFVQGDLIPRVKNLDEISSPYLMGLCDKFFDQNLIPIIQTTRGCPFKCTYCQDGQEYANQVSRFSLNRIKEELQYIAKRTTVPNCQTADDNFGMYREDLEICKVIAEVRKKYGWPEYFVDFSGKNNKKRVLEAIALAGVPHNLEAAVQSTDDKVLKNIKRSNVSWQEMIQLAKASENIGSTSFSEVILCLPGDTKGAHLKSLFDLIDAGILVVRSHQFIILPNSEAGTQESIEEYEMDVRFRVIPKTYAPYTLFGKQISAFEIDKICVANNTMTFEDYQQCRLFNLTVEIFYNNAIFQGFYKFLIQHGISASSFISKIHHAVCFCPGPLKYLYEDFLEETNDLWESEEELRGFFKQDGIIERYRSGEFGNNEQLFYRTLAFLKHMEDIHRIVLDVAIQMLEEKCSLNKQKRIYLKELVNFSIFCKKDLFSGNLIENKRFHYDFVKLVACKFNIEPLLTYKSKGYNVLIQHSEGQKKLISLYLKTFGSSDFGIGQILSSGANMHDLYRKAVLV